MTTSKTKNDFMRYYSWKIYQGRQPQPKAHIIDHKTTYSRPLMGPKKIWLPI